jgi:hypothetical protein
VDQVHLAQVRLRGVSAHAGAVLDGFPQVRVTLHAEPGEEAYRVDARLRHRVRAAPADGDDDCFHAV